MTDITEIGRQELERSRVRRFAGLGPRSTRQLPDRSDSDVFTPNPDLWFCVGLRGQSLRAPRNTHSGPSTYSTIESAAVLAVPSLSWFCFVTLVYVAIGPWLSTHSFFSYYYSSPLSCTPQTCTRSLTVRGVSRSGYSWTNSELSHSLCSA